MYVEIVSHLKTDSHVFLSKLRLVKKDWFDISSLTITFVFSEIFDQSNRIPNERQEVIP